MDTKIRLRKFYCIKLQDCLLLFLFFCALWGCSNNSNRPEIEKGTAPASLAISGGDIFDFGSQLVGITTEHTFTVTNSGAKSATDISGIFYFSMHFAFKDGSYPGSGGTCGAIIDPGSSCTVIVNFTPQIKGQAQSVLELDYNDSTGPKATSHPILNGRGI